MAIAFRAFTQAASGGATGSTGITAPALPTGTVAGDMVILVVVVKYVVGIIAPTDWTVVSNNSANNTGLTDSGNDAGNILTALYFREYDGVWSMPALGLLAASDCTMRGAISYSKGAAEAWVEPVCAGAADNSAGAAGVDPSASPTTISFAAGDFFGSVCGQNGDVGTFSAHTATVAGVTFGTQNTRLGAAITTGTDLRTHSIDKPYSSGTASAGPDGAMTLTGGAATTAGTFVFYRLRVAPKVSAVLAAPLGASTGTFTAVVEHPAVLAAPLGALTATATALPEHVVVLAAPLGSLSATGTAVPKHPAVLAAGLGGLVAAITATPEHPATLAAPLGALTATASASVSSGTNTVPAVLLAALGSLAGTATATPLHPVTAVAACGALTATAGATVSHSALGAAVLGGLAASASATVTTPPVVSAVLVANLGQLVAMANAGPPPPVIASVGFERFDVQSPAFGEVVSWIGALDEPMWEDFYI